MEQDRFKGLTPSATDLAFLKKNSKKLHKQGASKGKKLYVKKGMIDPMPCIVCAEIYDKYNSGALIKHEYCPTCRGKLESGMVALVCRIGSNGLYDGRYAFMVPDDHPMAQKLKGTIVGVDSVTMDSIILKNKFYDLAGDEVIQICPKCKCKKVEKRDADEPVNVVLVQYLCENCGIEGETATEPLYFDANLNPVETDGN